MYQEVEVKLTLSIDSSVSKADIELFINSMIENNNYLFADRLNEIKISSIKEEAEIYDVECTEQQFPNGVDSWMETHFEIVSRIAQVRLEDKMPESFEIVNDTEGTCGFYSLAKNWANEFEKANKGKVWDGEFFDEIDIFCNKKIDEVW